ncbi:MAG: hypothetical protein WDN28_31740 [Chthoniobacter sp.]
MVLFHDHDRFHSRWDQPTNIARAGPDIVTTLKIRIGKDGTILSREIVHSSAIRPWTSP